MTHITITITAASGKLGQAVAAELAARGLAAHTRLAARTPDKLAAQRAQGFATVAADYDDPASLRAAFAGTDALLLISGMGTNAQRAAQHKAAIDAAKAAGVRHIVYTSTTNPSHGSRFEWSGAHADTEAYLQAAGVPYTILRDNAYFSNNDALFAQAVASGTLAFPDIDAKVGYVAHEDVAAAAAGVLTGPATNAVFEISGAQAYSARELAAELSHLAGRPVEAVQVPLQAFTDQFRALGLPEFVVSGVTSFYAALAAGEFALISQDVERLGGRTTTSAREYLRRFTSADTATLERVFLNARSFNAFTERPVPDELLQRLYDLAKWGPTSMNSQPARFVFIRTPEAKARLLPALSPGNVEKTRKAPVTVIVAQDTRFFEHLPTQFPAYDARPLFENNAALAQATALRNSSLQGAYLIVAARLLGLDAGPMSGFDPAALNAEFFPDGRWQANFIINLGYGDPAGNHPRGPRLDTDEAVRFL
ncbi:malonic semialdehyde reductase [Pseudothauera nasutitermitis]|uniref:Putative NADH dehydrogenase/NAD(P)H nitroreductase E6C76_06200 n=1 Tax=Pseudothauera nasutitermitis TaxID=2565930 RepID=A0A4S4B3X4_9RHOO|nr:malonic semialdehyde reductase [Pseudothauera nasutitermitis]THF66430.1 malonic semialdehyde reductase [Pseudothauera nasutitermitis]